MTLTALLIIPFATALLCCFAGKKARQVALAGSLAYSAWVVWLLVGFQQSGGQPMHFSQPWIPALGATFSLSVDGISFVLLLLTAIVMPLIVYASFNRAQRQPHVFYSLLMLMHGAMTGSFIAADGFLFYIFWELALIPIYFICLGWGGENRRKITLKFFIYTMLGSLFMLFAFIWLYLHTPDRTFDIAALYEAGRSLPLDEQGLVFAGIFLAFAIKMPIFPLHGWQPETYYTAPTPGVMLLSGVMLKMAAYGIIRWLIPVVPQGVAEWGSVAAALSVASILYGSWLCIAQRDFKRLIAFASIADVGLISAGLLAANTQGVQGGLMEMVSHAISSVGLFFVYDIIVLRTGTSDMDRLGGIRSLDSRLAFLFFIIVLSVVGLPLTTGFVGEFLLILGLFQFNPVLGALAALSVILGAVYMLRAFQKIMLGEVKDQSVNFQKHTSQEAFVLVVVCIFIVWFGVFPKPVLALSEQSVIELLGSLPK